MNAPLRETVSRAVELGGLPVDDVLALLLPLFEQVRQCHETGRVAPLRGTDALTVVDNRVGFDPSATLAPRRDEALLARLDPVQSVSLEVRRGADIERDLRTGQVQRDEIRVDPTPGGPARIVAGWQRWEHLDGVHDEPTDIGSLGELLAALCCGLDLTDESDAAQLSRHHRNLFALLPALHPVVSSVASSMLAVHRRDRAQDLAEVIERLRTYRDQPEDFDLERVLAAGRSAPERREAVLGHLRDRLFDLSRRNPLLHFRATQRTLNLTQASVPLVLDVRSVRAEQLFTWGGAASKRLVSGKAVELGSLVRWEDAPYASAALDALISTARRDRAEYGADQLRLVVAFLRWHNVKDDPGVAIMSPLVMAPVTLTKQRGVRDSYALQLAGNEAEVNPVLRHELREVYGFALPDMIDLRDETAIETLRAEIERQARATQPGVSVTTVDRPRIELIRARAQTALQAYRRRRASTARPSIGRRQYAYSYARPGWAPLGIQIFRDRIDRQPLPISVELGDRPVPRQTMAPDTAATATGVVDTELFTLDVEGETNPYSWEVDLCTVSLANFNYRTLTLVRDYEALLDEPRANPAFDELFSDAPRDLPDLGADIAADDRFLVVPADGSQLTALSQARAADNFVIQGPPGTGKSQIITNLVADYLARGKRVLFVCQKRAALDVVHARLRSQGLDEVCTLIHDSQQDKKAFVHALRDTYERWLDTTEVLTEVESARTALLTELSAARAEIAGYESALTTDVDGVRLLDLVDRLVELAAAPGAHLSAQQRTSLPSPGAWAGARPAVDRLVESLVRTGGSTLAASPARVVGALLDEPRVDAAVAARAQDAAAAVDRLRAALAAAGDADTLTLADAARIDGMRAVLAALPAHRRAAVLDRRSAASGELAAAAAAQRDVVLAAQNAGAAASGWHAAVGADDARAALEIARNRETSLLRIFSGDWKRVRGLVAAGYSAPDRAIAPTVTQALEQLVARYDAEAHAATVARQSTELWGHADLSRLQGELDEVLRLAPPLAGWRDRFAADENAVASTHDLSDSLRTAGGALTGFLVDELPLSELSEILTVLTSAAGQATMRSAAGPLRELTLAHPGVLATVRRLDLSPDEIESAVLSEALATARSTMPAVDRLDGVRLADLLHRMSELAPTLRRSNADVITARLRDRFLAAVEHSQRSVTGMSPDERDRKKVWSAGRREVEHEFGKVRAYKSIRQLASDESGAVVAAMRPVWLMSPSSMADTLPLEADFDVVIFDEASQIPIEEAVPALFRARQVITVGDQMQLPPTQYFQTARDDSVDDEPSTVGVVLDADSFLAVSSARLPSTMLLWHYRSRYEALIQFSNAAFYGARLSTIPDRGDAGAVAGPIDVRVGAEPERADVVAAVDAMFARSISLMRVHDGVYVQRTNPAEARWIAELVREILLRDTGSTLGIVAFSEAQQSEIERALERLSTADAEFAARYEAELVREDDGQTVGLFVKNLENVQGDERDIIIMSVCYAPAADGRMRMNFGPINNAGGEKRLNVIFSRSKQHMVLVSSIDHMAITNTYNDGANTLKNFLRYAAAVSDGDRLGAQAVLQGLRDRHTTAPTEHIVAATITQLAAALEGRGLEVARDVGQSGFRVDLALRAPGAPQWRTAVLVDHAARVDADPLDERRVTQPAALATAGWLVEQVLATEWLERRDVVVDRLVARTTA